MDGLLLPYVTRCFRAVVVDRPRRADVVPPAGPVDGDDAGPGEPGDPEGSPGDERGVSDGTDTDMLLIDFR